MFTFLLRVSLVGAVTFEKWVDFTRDYPNKMPSTFTTVMLPMQFFIYNFVPYLTLMLMHYRNFEPQLEQIQELCVESTSNTSGMLPRDSAQL